MLETPSADVAAGTNAEAVSLLRGLFLPAPGKPPVELNGAGRAIAAGA